MPPRRLLLGAPALGVVLAACAGTTSITAEQVATNAEDALEKKVGARPDITCPDSLEVTAGAKTRCTLTADGLEGEYGVTITVKTVDDDYGLDVKVDREPVGAGE